MSIIDEAKNKVKQLKASINEVVRDTFETYKDVIIDFQVNKQLFEKGQDSKGSIIRPAYKPITIKIKRQKGQPTDRVTWKDTGRLHHAVMVLPRENEVEIIANVPYAKFLLKKYGDDVLGIQEDLLKEFIIKFVVPNIKKDWNDKLAKS